MKLLTLTALALLSPTLSFADTLLIVSSGQGMYGDLDKVNIATERFGAGLIENALKGEHRKVYRFEAYQYDQGNKSAPELVKLIKKIVSERQGDERLNVFSMQHGPDGTPFDGVRMDEIIDVIPRGFIKNVYATNCSEFGDIQARDNETIYIYNRSNWFSDNLNLLGVENYVYHANMNGTGVFTLPLLVDNIRELKDWKLAAYKTQKEFDQISARLIPNLASISEDEKLLETVPMLKGTGWEEIFISRMVVGSRTSSKENKSLMKFKKARGFEENIIAMEDVLVNALKTHCPEGLDPDMKCRANNVKIVPNRVFSNLFSELHGIFKRYDITREGCLPGFIVDPFLEAFEVQSKVKELCLVKKNDDHFVLRWKLKTPGLLKFRATLNASTFEDEDISDALRKITIANEGSIHFRMNQKRGETRLTFNGIKLFLNGFDGSGDYKTFSKVRLKGVKISDKGSASGRVRFLIFPVVAGVESKNVEEVDLPDYIKVFGIKWWKNR